MKDAYENTTATSFVKPKTPIVNVGQLCRHCETPVILNRHSKPPKHKPGGYYYEYWLACPNKRCRALYMIEAAKKFFDDRPPAAAEATKISPDVKQKAKRDGIDICRPRRVYEDHRSGPYIGANCGQRPPRDGLNPWDD